MRTADAVVIGGGVMGTSIAHHLARRRFGRVVLVEKRTICSGTSAKSSAIVRTHYTTRQTAAMSLLARTMIERFPDEVGAPSGFVRTGMLLIGDPAGRAVVERTVAMNRELGIETGFVTADDVRRIDPLLAPPDGAPTVYEPRSGYGSPHDLASGYAQAFAAAGGELLQETEVTDVEIAHGRVQTVRTTAGDIATAHVVIAAGPWATAVGRLAGVDLPVMASRQSIVTLRPPFPFGPDHPVAIDLVNEVYLRPETGNLILVGNTWHGDDRPGNPDDYEDRPDLEYSVDLATRLSGLMPCAADAGIAGGWSGMYEISPDWNPIMGTARDTAGLHYCVGFSGHGFKLSPVAGLLMAELVVDGLASSLDITPYRLERFAEGGELKVAYARAGVLG